MFCYAIFELMEEIKLIWDFRSNDAEKIAEHHVKHLNEYIKSKSIENAISGFEMITPSYYIAFILTTKQFMIQLRDDLKPHRGERV